MKIAKHVPFGQRSAKLKELKHIAEKEEKKIQLQESMKSMSSKELRQVLGLPSSFTSTKGKHINQEACNLSASNIIKTRKYAQHIYKQKQYGKNTFKK